MVVKVESGISWYGVTKGKSVNHYLGSVKIFVREQRRKKTQTNSFGYLLTR